MFVCVRGVKEDLGAGLFFYILHSIFNIACFVFCILYSIRYVFSMLYCNFYMLHFIFCVLR